MNALALRLACVAAAIAAVAVHAQPTDSLYMPEGATDIWTGKPSVTYVWGSNAANIMNASGVHPGTGAAVERDSDGWVSFT